MQESLHLSSSAAVSTAPLPLDNHPNSPSIPRPKHLHFPPTKTPPISLKSQDSPPVSPATSENTQIQEIILYLDSIGVESFYCLQSHPPLISTPVSHIRSTVDFLLSIGVTLPDLRRIFPMCPELLTSSTVIPATTFLLREARVEAANLRHVIHRRPRLLICSVDRQLRPTLYFLQGTIGIEDVSKWTSLLSCSVESKFIPRIEYLQMLGFAYRETIVMFRRFPSLFCYSIKENLEPKFNYFVVEMGRELKELVAFPQYFSFSLENRIKPRHRMCLEKGVCLALPTMLKSSEARLRERLEVCCSSSAPVMTSPLWTRSINTHHSEHQQTRILSSVSIPYNPSLHLSRQPAKPSQLLRHAVVKFPPPLVRDVTGKALILCLIPVAVVISVAHPRLYPQIIPVKVFESIHLPREAVPPGEHLVEEALITIIV